MRVPLVDPETHEPLVEASGALVNPGTGEVVAPIVAGLPRFVLPEEDYATSFGWQWNRWEHVRSDSRSQGHRLGETILHRTRFGEFDLEGKTLLECGMGGGDDTEVLLSLPLGEIHAFDISTSVDRAARYLKDERLTITRASIYEIPYPDASFDFVFCHRVPQHTPDPERALRCICAKVGQEGCCSPTPTSGPSAT